VNWVGYVAAAWVVLSFPGALFVARSIRETEQRRPQPAPDFLWNQPTNSLSKAAVDVRFREIVAPLERDEYRRWIEARRAVLRNQQRGAA